MEGMVYHYKMSNAQDRRSAAVFIDWVGAGGGGGAVGFHGGAVPAGWRLALRNQDRRPPRSGRPASRGRRLARRFRFEQTEPTSEMHVGT